MTRSETSNKLPVLTTLVLSSFLISAIMLRSIDAYIPKPPAMPALLTRSLVTSYPELLTGMFVGTLSFPQCAGEVKFLIMPALYSSIDTDLAFPGNERFRFVTMYAGRRLPEPIHRYAMTVIHFAQVIGTSVGLWKPTFETMNVVRFAIPSYCTNLSDANIRLVLTED